MQVVVQATVFMCCVQCFPFWEKSEEPHWPCTPWFCACWSCVFCSLPPASSSPSTTASATPMRPTWGPGASMPAAPSVVGGWWTHIWKKDEKDIEYWVFGVSLSCFHSLLVCPGAHHICPEREIYQHGGGNGEELHPGHPRGADEQVRRDAARLLPGHPLCGFVSSHHRADLHVRPRRLHTQERAAEAHRGCTQGDHDVLVTLERAGTRCMYSRNMVLQLH